MSARSRGWAVAAGLVAAFVVSSARADAVDRRLGAGIARPAAAAATPWSSDAASRLTRDLDALLDGAPALRGAHVGVLALDTRTGMTLYARNADDAFQPASTLKLLTGSVALAKLGPDYRFRTQALLDSSNATLYIHGGGDPLLAASDLNAMAQRVRTAGIVALGSGVFIDASDFDGVPYPPGWSWDDFPYDYAPVISAATIEENVVHLAVAPGAASGAPVVVTGAPPPFEHFGKPFDGCPLTHAIVVLVRATTSERGSDATVDNARTPGGCIEVIGALPQGSEPQTLDAAVPSPIWYMRALAFHALDSAGVAAARLDVVAGPAETADGASTAPADARVVWTHDGEPLADLVADMWFPSDNLVAELLLKAVGRQARGVPGTTANGADVERAWLTSIGVDPATVTLADGSGLSSYDRVTPRALAAVLQADWNSPFRDVVIDDLPLAGVRGTLAKSFIGSLAERRAFAKTGSFNHTRALAGYLATLHHGALTFVWSVDDWMGTDADLNALRARVLSRLIGD